MYDYFCKNAAGTIVYCMARDDDGNGNCEGQETCEPFTPQCNGQGTNLECGNTLPGQTEARFESSSEPSGYSWEDSTRNANCRTYNALNLHALTHLLLHTHTRFPPPAVHKYGLLYERFITDTFDTYTNNVNDEFVQTQIRPCYPDSTVTNFRNLYENVVTVLDGDYVESVGLDRTPYDLGYGISGTGTACSMSRDGGAQPPYVDGYRGNRNSEFWQYIPNSPYAGNGNPSCHTGANRGNVRALPHRRQIRCVLLPVCACAHCVVSILAPTSGDSGQTS